MLKITLKNGSVEDVDSGTTLFEIAKNLGGSLYKEVCVARVDGELKDLKYSVKKDCSVEFLTFDSEDGKKPTGTLLLILWLKLFADYILVQSLLSVLQ